MGDPTKGTDNIPLTGQWFIEEQAECVDSLDTYNELFDESTDGSDLANFIDNDEVDEGRPLALFNSQMAEESNQRILELKRKYVSPIRSVAELSPRLEAVSISPQRQSKRRLFEDSGIVEDEAASPFTVQVDNEAPSQNGAAEINLNILNANSRKAVMLGKFKEHYGVPFGELTRAFKSDKTCTENWVLYVLCVGDEVIQSSKVLLQKYCNYIQLVDGYFSALYLLAFKAAKCRETVMNLFANLLNIQNTHMLCEPPKIRSAPAAFFFYQKNMTNCSYAYGSTPQWIAQHTLINHAIASTAESFSLSEMIQWAYDNEFTEDYEVAYHYALEAETNRNAAAFLNSNCQAKYVKDCVQMLKLYRRQELKNTTMSQWIQRCCKRCSGSGDWKIIACLLRMQNINVVQFLIAVRSWLKNIPKRNCMVIHGPPDTGKSYFSYSLIKFLRGKVVSVMNRNSHFWLQPLKDCKVGLIDDATYPFWEYADINLRAAFDGNDVSVDAKHKDPVQMKLPPLLITSNVNVMKEVGLRYLHSRLTAFEFPNKMPIEEDGTPQFKLTDEVWKSFFMKLAPQLDISFEEEDESADTDRAFRCTAGRTADII